MNGNQPHKGDKGFAFSRRDVAKLLVAAPIAARGGIAQAADDAVRAIIPVETRSLDELHKAALAEGGDLLVYGGGDLPNGSAGTERAFNARFPGMKLRILVDRSKFHGVRINNQLARGRLACDAVHILTIHDFDGWKADDRLLPYKPLGWDQVWPEFRDPDGAYTTITIYAFATVFNVKQLTEAEAPRDAVDYLDPKLKGRIVLVYPQDDDSILYQFDRIIAQHGWDYMDRLAAQDVRWVRGSGVARVMVANGDKAVTFSASGPLVTPPNATSRLILPRNDRFLSWPQPAAIFKDTKHPAAAKLYMSWLLSTEVQSQPGRQWTIRRDVPTAGGFGAVFDYNTAPVAFREFLHERERLEKLRDQLDLVIGPMQGPNPTKVEGIYPSAT